MLCRAHPGRPGKCGDDSRGDGTAETMVTLGEIFPDARFIHMLRDGRDVACSLLTQDWVDAATGRRYDFVEATSGAAGRVLEVRYEALVTEPAATMRQVSAFLGEQWDEAVIPPG